MAIEIDRLSVLLLKMADENAPGREFSTAIAELARTGRFANLKDVLPPVVYDELWERHQANPVVFVEEWEHLAQEMQKGFIHHARQRLTSLTRIQQASNGHPPAWKAIQRALDSRQNDLLRAAVDAEFLDLVEHAPPTCESASSLPQPAKRPTAIWTKRRAAISSRSSPPAP